MFSCMLFPIEGFGFPSRCRFEIYVTNYVYIASSDCLLEAGGAFYLPPTVHIHISYAYMCVWVHVCMCAQMCL